jgi:hypothetical protein
MSACIGIAPAPPSPLSHQGYRWRIKSLTPHPNDFIGFDGLFQTAIAILELLI